MNRRARPRSPRGVEPRRASRVLDTRGRSGERELARGGSTRAFTRAGRKLRIIRPRGKWGEIPDLSAPDGSRPSARSTNRRLTRGGALASEHADG